MNPKTVFYSAIGDELALYEIDGVNAALTRRSSVRLPANVQYAWPHPSNQFLYVTSSDRKHGVKSAVNHLSAFRIDANSGELTPHGEPCALRYRSIHMSLDATGAYALVAYSEPAAVSILRIRDDGTLGDEVIQPAPLDYGIYPHQILAFPSNKGAILVTRGNSAKEGRPEEPGALKVFTLNEGVLGTGPSIAPNGGYGFGPRHIDFHPSKPWIYVSLERENKLSLFLRQGDAVNAAPAVTLDLLADRTNVKPRQLAGAIHVHPSGRFVYGVNRADLTVDFNGRPVFGGGENSIVVCSIDPVSGAPAIIQRVDPRLIHVRTFSIDASGSILIAASIKPMMVQEGATAAPVAAGLSLFRIGVDGKLEFARKYDLETGGKTQFWTGMVVLPQ